MNICWHCLVLGSMAIIGVFSLIYFCITSNNAWWLMEYEARKTCIEKGGSVITGISQYGHLCLLNKEASK